MVHVKTIQMTFSGSSEMLNDVPHCERVLDAITDKIGLTKLHTIHHQFQPQGVSIVQLLAESHIAMHTWPETSQGYITITTCKLEAMNEDSIRALLEQYNLQIVELLTFSESLTA